METKNHAVIQFITIKKVKSVDDHLNYVLSFDETNVCLIPESNATNLTQSIRNVKLDSDEKLQKIDECRPLRSTKRSTFITKIDKKFN